MTSLFRSAHRLAAGGVFGVLMLAAPAARSQPTANPILPRSPYALPAPTYRAPSDDELINGNGKLHFSGQWRHWGDHRNQGELFYSLFGPRDGLGDQTGPNGLPR